MMRPAICVVCLLLTSLHTSGQCTEDAGNKVLLVGDSWAFFMGVDQTINGRLEKWGHSGYRYLTNLVLAENGAETDDFLSAGKQAEIAAQLVGDPGIRVVHLSLGGNDVLGDWDVDFTQEEIDALEQDVLGRLQEVIAFILDVRPDIHVLWSGYMYPNFGEVIGELGPLQAVHPFYATWQGMGQPDFQQLNTILNQFSASMESYAGTMDRVTVVNATGLMQHVFGQEQPLGVAPGGTYAPGEAALPAGFINYPSPKESMRDYLLTRDCFHLSTAGYNAMVDNHMLHFYHKFLMDDQYLLAQPAGCGSISDLGTVDDRLRLGSEGGEQFSTVLTFPTTSMAGTVVEAASVFLRRSSLTGVEPVGATLEVKVRNGGFSGSFELEAADADDPGDASGVACRFGSIAGEGHWIRIDLPPAVLPFLGPGSDTQFMVGTGTPSEGMVTFTGTDDPDLAPVLNLVYGDVSTGVPSVDAAATLPLYPNPTEGPVALGVPFEAIVSIRVFDAMGRIQPLPIHVGGTMDLGPLPGGHYMVEVITTTGRTVGRVVKW